MTYAIISLGGKQYRVQEGQRLVVDRLPHEDKKTFHPNVLFVGGDGKAEFAPKGVHVTATVVGSALGEKIRIGKYKKRTGYRRHTGHRSKLTQIEITAIGAAAATRKAAETMPLAEAAAKPKAPARPRAAAKPKAEPAKPKASAKPRAAAKTKPAATTESEGGAE